MLIVLAVSKLLATTLLLATGWKGGYIFPIMFAGIALGLACDLLLPGLPVAGTGPYGTDRSADRYIQLRGCTVLAGDIQNYWSTGGR